MRITGIELKNWMIHRHLAIDISPLTIIAGPNESGKSSIADAVAFVVFNEIRRVRTKGDRPQLISEGASKGVVTVRAGEATIKRDISTGKLSSDAMMPVREGAISQAVPYLLSPALFGRVEPDDRRQLLSKVMQVDLGAQNLLKVMEERGAASYVIKGLPVSKDIEQWRALAKAGASEARGSWKQITGDTYGSDKAETWEAEEPPPITSTVESLESAVKAASDNAVQKAAALAGYLTRRQAENERAKKIAPLEVAAGSLAAAEADLDNAKTRLALTKEELQNALNESRHGSLFPAALDTLNCPSCGSILTMTDDGNLEEIKTSHSNNDNERTTAARNAVKRAEDGVATKEAAVAAAKQAKATLVTISEMGPSVELVTLDELQESAESARAYEAVQREALAKHKENAAALARAKKLTGDAKTAHERVLAWKEAEAWLAPDGIPGELLNKALQPFNATLATLSARAGWKIVSLTDEMEIIAGGRTYDLHSESGQWRIDAIIAIALAIHSNLRLVTLDRFDVLDLPARNPALRFFLSLTNSDREEIDTLLVLGTFKAPPAAPSAVKVHWLGQEPEAVKAAA
jgi:hypothetical protein